MNIIDRSDSADSVIGKQSSIKSPSKNLYIHLCDDLRSYQWNDRNKWMTSPNGDPTEPLGGRIVALGDWT